MTKIYPKIAVEFNIMSMIILFDGVCNFCNSSINFVIEKDKRDAFKFAPLQSEIGQKLLAEHKIDSAETDSVILIENDKAYTHSTAALRIAKNLGGIWSFGYVLIIVPKFIRDFFYKLLPITAIVCLKKRYLYDSYSGNQS